MKPSQSHGMVFPRTSERLQDISAGRLGTEAMDVLGPGRVFANASTTHQDVYQQSW